MSMRHFGYAKRRAILATALMVFLAALFCTPIVGASAAELHATIKQFAADDLVPGADGYAEVDANARFVPVLKGGQTAGYVFLNTDFDNAIGYSGKPITILIGLDTEGRITGARMVEHSEPIVLGNT